jgi:hypothetical protein
MFRPLLLAAKNEIGYSNIFRIDVHSCKTAYMPPKVKPPNKAKRVITFPVDGLW